MEYFFCCRGRSGTEALLEELAEAHWSFMDGYAEAMIARGPTLTPDRTTWTGSVHMVDVPDAQAARVFAFQKPFYRVACIARCCAPLAQRAGPHDVGLPRRARW